MSTQIVISSKLAKAYDSAIAEVEASHGEATTAISNYWWKLYQIRQQELWRARYEHFTDWLGDFVHEPFGESQQTYYNAMNGMDMAFKMGLTEPEVKEIVGRRKVALEGDLRQFFDKNGKGELKPEILKQITDGGETPAQYLLRIAELPPGESRQEVRGMYEKEKVYVTDDPAHVSPENGTALFNVIWESHEDGIMWKGTIKITGTEITEPRRHKRKEDFIPEKVIAYLLDKLGVVR